MKTYAAAFLAAFMALSMMACASSEKTQEEETAVKEETENTEAEVPEETPAEEHSSDSLIIVFSRTGEQYNVGEIEKGNTMIVAEMIQNHTGADLFEILPEDDYYPYTYNELTEVAKQEQQDQARPAYKGDLPDLSQYSTVFIGSPVWWGDYPMLMYTVLENNDFHSRKLVPFATSEGGGLAGMDEKLKSLFPDSEVTEGLAIRGTDAQQNREETEAKVSGWLEQLGFAHR